LRARSTMLAFEGSKMKVMTAALIPVLAVAASAQER
jgi:hypothetical protein